MNEPTVAVLGAGALGAAKATAMDTNSYAAGFAVEFARKDLGLVEQTLPPSPLLLAVRQRLDQVIADGHGHDDLAAVDYRRGNPD